MGEALGLDPQQIEAVGKIYHRFMLAFSEARRQRIVPVNSGEDGVFWGEVAPQVYAIYGLYKNAFMTANLAAKELVESL